MTHPKQPSSLRRPAGASGSPVASDDQQGLEDEIVGALMACELLAGPIPASIPTGHDEGFGWLRDVADIDVEAAHDPDWVARVEAAYKFLDDITLLGVCDRVATLEAIVDELKRSTDRILDHVRLTAS